MTNEVNMGLTRAQYPTALLLLTIPYSVFFLLWQGYIVFIYPIASSQLQSLDKLAEDYQAERFHIYTNVSIPLFPSTCLYYIPSYVFIDSGSFPMLER